MTGANPKFVYRLATLPEWIAAQEGGVIPTRDVDKCDGYMHLSTRAQLIETANLYFAGSTDLVALEIPLQPIDSQIKFELAPKRGEEFPHLYGALTVDHVNRAIELIADDDGFHLAGEE